MSEKSYKFAYAVSRREGKNFHTKIGIAFPNPDGSIVIRLDALPVSGEIIVRDPDARYQQARTPRDSGSEGEPF